MSTSRDFRRKIATDFYRTFCPDAIGQVDFIDLNYSVRDVRIAAGTRLWGFKDPRVSPLRTTFFCVPGTPIEILGVHDSGTLKTNPTALAKVLNEYEVLRDVPHALESVCAEGIDSWSEFERDARGRLQPREHPVAGGGWQYKIPRPHLYLRYTSPFPQG